MLSFMSAPLCLPWFERLRLRLGDECWLCRYPMRFNAPPNSPRAPTRKHRVPRALGGTNAADNVVMCHRRCNAHLKDRTLEQKLKIQAKWHAAFERQQAAREKLSKRDAKAR